MIILTSLAYNLFFSRLRIFLLSLAICSSFACEFFFFRLRFVLLSLTTFSSFACDIVAYESILSIFPFAFSSCLHHIFCFVCFILLFRFVAVSTLIALFSAFIDCYQRFYWLLSALLLTTICAFIDCYQCAVGVAISIFVVYCLVAYFSTYWQYWREFRQWFWRRCITSRIVYHW